MGILFIILIIVLVELIQILNSRFKIRKWILPILFFINSINIILGMFVYEQHDSPNSKIETITLISYILIFIILNIPTLMFIVTNFIVNKKQETNEKFYKNVKLCALITMVLVIVLFVFIQISSLKHTTEINIKERKNTLENNLTI
jgi:cytochrome bd-type quinol oxidase subunit 2